MACNCASWFALSNLKSIEETLRELPDLTNGGAVKYTTVKETLWSHPDLPPSRRLAFVMAERMQGAWSESERGGRPNYRIVCLSIRTHSLPVPIEGYEWGLITDPNSRMSALLLHSLATLTGIKIKINDDAAKVCAEGAGGRSSGAVGGEGGGGVG